MKAPKVTVAQVGLNAPQSAHLELEASCVNAMIVVVISSRKRNRYEDKGT
jgi:hypothetical protein